MKALKERIKKDGEAIGTEVVKVDGFLNHQIDVQFMSQLGKEFRRRFADLKIDKILTVEASGIAIACMTAPWFGYPPVVFAKKTKPNTMTDEFYGAEARSFTKGTVSIIRVSKKYLHQGEAATAMTQLVSQAGAEVAGIGAVIEKGFQGGGDRLRKAGFRLESLAIIERIEKGKIRFV